MRVTERMMTDNAINYMTESKSLMSMLQEKTATGKQFSRASDNPSAAVSALNLKSTIETSKGYLNTTSLTESWMSATDTSLQSMIKVAKQALKLAQDGVSDTQGTEERASLAAEMDVLLQEGIDLGNTKYQDSYIFAGFKVTTTPFSGVDNNADGLYDAVAYAGDDKDHGTILRTVGPGQSIAQNITGEVAFTAIFQGIIQARNALNDPNTASDKTALESAMAALNQGITDLNNASTTNGARQRQVKSIGERLESTQIELASLLSQKEDVNMAEAISLMTAQENVYQAVLEVGQRTISALNLFQMLG